MSIEEIIDGLNSIAREKQAKNAGLPDGWPLDTGLLDDETVLREAIALLKTHPEAQPDEPLTLEELREMGNKWVWIKILVPLGGIESGYFIKKVQFSDEQNFVCGYPGDVRCRLAYSGYMDIWKAYGCQPKEEV